MKTPHESTRNRRLLIAVAAGFAIAACAFLYAVNLAEYEGSLAENLSYEVPEGYEPVAGNSDADANSREYARVTDTTRERILICYDGFDGSRYFEWEDPVKLDDSTKCSVTLNNWSHNEYNELLCEIRHEEEAYEVRYRCQETDKKDYYSSCSKQQQEELLAFVRTFDYHRPANEEVGNVFKRLYLNYGVAGLGILGLVIAVFIGIPIGAATGVFPGSGEEEESSDQEKM